MKTFLVICATTALMMPALTGCHGKTVSESRAMTEDWGLVAVRESKDVNGVKSKIDLQITHFAARTPPTGQTVTAAYFVVENKGPQADRLVSASCACAASSTLHIVVKANGMSMMQDAPDGFALPPGQALTFAPGGNHIMLSGLKSVLKNGDKIDVVLTFAKAGPIVVHMPIKDAPGMSDDAMSGMKM